MSHVFLSYSRKDVKAADRIQDYLQARGLTIFRDIEMGAGENWVKKTGEMLRSSGVVLVLWSKHSVASDNVSHEAMIAKELGKLVPAMIDDVQGMDLPMGLSVVQAADVKDWRNADSTGLERLAAAIERHIKAPLKPAPKPTKRLSWSLIAAGVAVVAISVGGVYYLTSPSRSRTVEEAAAPSSGPDLPISARDVADEDEPPESGDDLIADPVATMTANGALYDLEALPPSVKDVVNRARDLEKAARVRAAEADAAATEARKQQAAAQASAVGTAALWNGNNLVEGQYSGDRFNGYAVVTRKKGQHPGDAYLGQMQGWDYRGLGVFEYTSTNPLWKSVSYRGEWGGQRGVPHGLGVIEFKNNQWFAGQLNEGRMEGTGVYRDAQVVYEGEYTAGAKNGIGVRWHARDNSIEAGRWSAGRYLGPVTQ